MIDGRLPTPLEKFLGLSFDGNLGTSGEMSNRVFPYAALCSFME